MKRYGNIYPKIYEMGNLRLAHKKARKDKSYYNEVKMVDSNEEYYLKEIQIMLKNKTYFVGEDDYTMFEKNDKGKVREIYKLDYYPHRIIQHALLNQIEDIYLRSLIDNTFSSIPKRGVHKTLKKLTYDLRNFEDKTQYCLQVDIEKFYPSVNHEVAKHQHERKFKDKDLLWLVNMLIESLGEGNGLAIGSLFSQWGGNFNLSGLDHYLKEEVGVKFYYRYCDDLVILSSNKEELHQIRRLINRYLEDNLKLRMKNNYKIYPVDIQGIDFIGYRHFRRYILLRKTTALSLMRKMREIQAKIDNGGEPTYSDYCSINSYKGWLKWCNGHNLYTKWIEPLEPYCDKYYREVIKGENL